VTGGGRHEPAPKPKPVGGIEGDVLAGVEDGGRGRDLPRLRKVDQSSLEQPRQRDRDEHHRQQGADADHYPPTVHRVPTRSARPSTRILLSAAERSATCIDNASDFTVAPPAPLGSRRIPAWPRSSPVTCTNGLPAASAVTWRPYLFRPVPRGLASGGAKVERNPAAVRPVIRTYAAGNVGVRVGGRPGLSGRAAARGSSPPGGETAPSTGSRCWTWRCRRDRRSRGCWPHAAGRRRPARGG